MFVRAKALAYSVVIVSVVPVSYTHLRRYLQCADGASEPDRTACAQQCGGQRNERLFCEDEIERNQQNPLDLFYDSSYNKETYERNVDEE